MTQVEVVVEVGAITVVVVVVVVVVAMVAVAVMHSAEQQGSTGVTQAPAVKSGQQSWKSTQLSWHEQNPLGTSCLHMGRTTFALLQASLEAQEGLQSPMEEHFLHVTPGMHTAVAVAVVVVVILAVVVVVVVVVGKAGQFLSAHTAV